MSGYPSGYDTFPEHHDPAGEVRELITAADINDLGISIEAIQAELGLNPSGTASTVVDRFAALPTDAGATGPTGPAGATGPDGLVGATGPAGDAGPTGPAGADSTTPGPTGPSGVAGVDGADGAAGADGVDGATGPNPFSGIWDSATTYTVDQIVSYADELYACLRSTTGENPAVIPDADPTSFAALTSTGAYNDVLPNSMAQGFTVPANIMLYAISIYSHNNPGSAVVELRSSPGSSALASGTIADFTATGSDGFMMAVLDSPYALVAGTTYYAAVHDGLHVNNYVALAPNANKVATGLSAVGDLAYSTTDNNNATTGVGYFLPFELHGPALSPAWQLIDTGVVGATGATGPAGGAGSPGSTGPTGVSGADGTAGSAGASGATGPIGPTGATGPAGAIGATGPAGPTGVTGPSGSAGADGTAGSAGVAGPTGVTGPGGSAGSAGSDGAVGATGPTGATGVTGAGTTGATGPIGATGTTGPAGATGASGASSSSIHPFLLMGV
jgi:hypothetical protein